MTTRKGRTKKSRTPVRLRARKDQLTRFSLRVFTDLVVPEGLPFSFTFLRRLTAALRTRSAGVLSAFLRSARFHFFILSRRGLPRGFSFSERIIFDGIPVPVGDRDLLPPAASEPFRRIPAGQLPTAAKRPHFCTYSTIIIHFTRFEYSCGLLFT